MKPRPERNNTLYVAADGNTTKIKPIRWPVETLAVIDAAMEYYNIATFTDCVFQLLDRGLKEYQAEDKRFDDIIFDTINNVEMTPRKVVPGQKRKTKEDRELQQQHLTFMRENYQWLTKDEFVKEGIPGELVDTFLEKLG